MTIHYTAVCKSPFSYGPAEGQAAYSPGQYSQYLWTRHGGTYLDESESDKTVGKPRNNLAVDGGTNSCRALYLSIAIPLPSVLAAAAVFQPQIVPALGYAPVIVAFVLWIIEDYYNLDPAACCLAPWWAYAMHGSDDERTTVRDSTMGVHGSVAPVYRVDIDDAARQDSLLLRHMWDPSTSQSCALSSRLSDISLSSSGLDSLPSSWGTLTRTWFPEFSAQGEELCRRSRTV